MKLLLGAVLNEGRKELAAVLDVDVHDATVQAPATEYLRSRLRRQRKRGGGFLVRVKNLLRWK